MHELRERLCEEMEHIAQKGNLGMRDLDTLHKLASTVKNLDKIMQRGESRYSSEGYSRDGEWEADMRGTYGRGSSYARRGTHYVRGHYSRSGMREQLEALMECAGTDAERDAIRRCIESMDAK